MCFPLGYSYRTRRLGHAYLITSYVLPSLLLAIFLNIPRILEISPLGARLDKNKYYLRFYMYYQVTWDDEYETLNIVNISDLSSSFVNWDYSIGAFNLPQLQGLYKDPNSSPKLNSQEGMGLHACKDMLHGCSYLHSLQSSSGSNRGI